MNLETTIATGLWGLWAAYSGPIQESVIRKLTDTVNLKAKDAAKAAWERVDWKLSAQRYQEKLLEMYGSIQILGKPEPVSLEGVFTDVLMLETPTAFHRYDIKLLRKEPQKLYKNKARKDGLELVKNVSNRRIFVLGKPGAGKTTFLKYLTIQAAKGKLEKIPIFVSLKEWADSSQELMEFLVRQFDICDFPDAGPFVEHLLRKGDALLLFDGLDEVNQEGNQRSAMITRLRDFSNKYSKSQCLVTCRVAATEYTFERFNYVEIADFTDKQVDTFVRKWFRGSRKKRALFNEAFSRVENKGLQELARVPLLLSLLCISFDATLEFPQRRVEIYEEALEALLKKWDTSRSIKRDEIYRGLSLGRKRQMFARIAAQTFQEGKYFLPQAELSKHIVSYLRQLPRVEHGEEIDGDSILKAIEAQHSIFTERAHRIYSFSHLTFQEYFTAKQIASDTTGRALRSLLAIETLTDDRWREVILLTVSLLDDADDFFDIFMASLKNLAKEEPVLVSLLVWVNEITFEHEENTAPLKAYYLYLVFSLILAPALLGPQDTEIHSFGRSYSSSQIIEICSSLAQKLDRLQSLSGIISRDTLKNLKGAHKALATFKCDDVPSIPGFLIEEDSAIALHLTQAFFFVLTITNLRESIDTRKLTNALRSYFLELRKFAIALSSSQTFGEVPKASHVEESIAIACRDLVVPPETAALHAWVKLVENIHAIIEKNALRKNRLTEAQATRLVRFFIATRLFVDCLSMAVVSNRGKIQDRLFLPSKE
jgi:hypothetical protein